MNTNLESKRKEWATLCFRKVTKWCMLSHGATWLRQALKCEQSKINFTEICFEDFWCLPTRGRCRQQHHGACNLVNLTCVNLNLLISPHAQAGEWNPYKEGAKCASRLNLLNAGWSGSSLMSVYACSQEVVITGDGGVTQGNTVSRCRRRAGDLDSQMWHVNITELIARTVDDGNRWWWCHCPIRTNWSSGQTQCPALAVKALH